MAGYRPYGFFCAYTISGATPHISSRTMAAQTWVQGAVLWALAAGTVDEADDDTSDVLGSSMEDVASGVSGGPNSATCMVAVMNADTVWRTVDAADLTAPTVAEIGALADLDLAAGSGATAKWGILQGTAGTGSTPNFRIIDVDTVRLEYIVIPAPLEVADVFQMFDAAI